MRSLSGTLITETGKTVTRPVYLVYMGFSSPVRLSSRGQVLYDGEFWAARDFKLTNSTPVSAVLTIRNDDLSMGAEVLGDIESIPVQVFMYYGTTTTPSASDVISIFEGYLNEVRAVTVDYVTINCIAITEHYAKVPRYRVNTDEFNHLPLAGRTFTWGGERAVIETDY